MDLFMTELVLFGHSKFIIDVTISTWNIRAILWQSFCFQFTSNASRKSVFDMVFPFKVYYITLLFLFYVIYSNEFVQFCSLARQFYRRGRLNCVLFEVYLYNKLSDLCSNVKRSPTKAFLRVLKYSTGGVLEVVFTFLLLN